MLSMPIWSIFYFVTRQPNYRPTNPNSKIMETLFKSSAYQDHLKARGQRQLIQLGYSDSTKDGGYLTATWALHQAQRTLSNLARRYQVQVTFFHGRGGAIGRSRFSDSIRWKRRLSIASHWVVEICRGCAAHSSRSRLVRRRRPDSLPCGSRTRAHAFEAHAANARRYGKP